MSERLGTCLHCWQPMQAEIVPFDAPPGAQGQIEDLPSNLYFCGILNTSVVPAPPPLARMNATFEIRAGDCEACAYFVPADGGLLIQLWKKKRTAIRSRRRRLAKKAEAG